jgi:hypothetical protein
MKPNTESAAGAIGARSSAKVPDLKPGLPLELGRLPEAVDEPDPDVEVDVTLGISDDGTAEMGEGDWPPYGGLHSTHHVSIEVWGFTLMTVKRRNVRAEGQSIVTFQR